VFTTAMSSISMAVAAHTTTSVQRWICIKAPGRERGGEGAKQDLAAGASPHQGRPQSELPYSP
jgi:hypothetical protein